MSTEHFFPPWPGLADLGWARSCNWSAGGLARAHCSPWLSSLLCLGLRWETWADSAPCSRILQQADLGLFTWQTSRASESKLKHARSLEA